LIVFHVCILLEADYCETNAVQKEIISNNWTEDSRRTDLHRRRVARI